MNIAQVLTLTDTVTDEDSFAQLLAKELQEWLGQKVDLWDARSRKLVGGDLGVAEAICESTEALSDIYRSGQADFIAESDALLIAALPLRYVPDRQWIAVFPVLARPICPADDRVALAEMLGRDPAEVDKWAARQPVCSPEIASRLAMAFLMNKEAELQKREMGSQLEATSERLASTYEEITLFHRLTQNLSVSSSDEELGQQAIEWMLEYLPASGCGLYLLPAQGADRATYETRSETTLLQVGEFQITQDALEDIVAQSDLECGCGPHLLLAEESEYLQELGEVREVLIANVCDRGNTFGQLILINKIDSLPFEAKDINMLSSVSAILGTHCGNYELYRQQSEFLADVVRALTSAIDAKDQYTCGHSDRVARIAVRLARELNCSTADLHTIYMAGLLHDIGKIGINDAVLQKPDALTAEEFEHIKQHPQLGCNILADIPQFALVVPIVLHHHEQWNGRGYPAGLTKEEIPLLARITAVADAFDAMTSSRCYRNGMPLEKVEKVLRDGAGTQWDATVINAYFRAREDILNIARNEREGLSLNVKSWL